MQFLMYSTEQTAAPGTPMTPEQLAALGQLMEESARAGVLISTGSAAPTGLRVRNSGSKFTTTDGPFIEAKELTGGYAIVDVASLEDAVAWAKRFRSIIGDGTTEIVRLYGPGDSRQA